QCPYIRVGTRAPSSSGLPDRCPVLLGSPVTGHATPRGAGVIAEKVITLRTRHREAAARGIAPADRRAATDQSRARAAGSPSGGRRGTRRESRTRVSVLNRDGGKGAGAGTADRIGSSRIGIRRSHTAVLGPHRPGSRVRAATACRITGTVG